MGIALKVAGYNPRLNAKDYYFDIAIARHYVEFIETCICHTEGELQGEPFILEPWQKKIVMNAFGWFHRKTGKRRFNELFLYVPRKNGKTTLAAAMGLALLFVDGEPGAQIYAAAAAKEQTGAVFAPSKYMVEHEPELLARAKVYGNSITIPSTGSYFKAISSKAATKHGQNMHGAVVDELHAHKTDELLETLITGTASRRNPMVIITTTADFNRPESPCNKKLDYARKVRDGAIIDPSFFPIIYEALIKDDWKKVSTHRKANPNYGVSLDVDYFKRKLQRAIDDPSFENTFKRLHLNIVTEQAEKVVPMDRWKKCPKKVDESAIAEAECWGGLDLAQSEDICAFVLVWPELGNLFKSWFWVPEAHRECYRIYKPWVDSGHLVKTPGEVTDYNYIRKEIVECCDKYNVQDIGADPYNATHLMNQLTEEDGIRMVAFRQGYISMNEPTKELLKLVKAQTMCHEHNPVLGWMAGNCTARRDVNENMMFSKKESPGKIDGMVAAVMALGRSLSGETIEFNSVYRTRGVIMLEDD